MHTRPVRDIVRHQRIFTITPDTTVRTAAVMMKEFGVGSLMVTAGDRLTGIFTERDALFRVLAGGLDPTRTTVEQVMTPDPLTVTPDCMVLNALHRMHDGGFRHMPVVEDGRPVGMVSIRDAVGPELATLERELDEKEALAEILA
ncbi:CBS domain-containing protein [Azospirillum fermentarium]|uniref:CBS domain-containing protein n=1 Tax=Azospirillum fermentarium TaxID=1233114 RepID=UPI002227B8AF|nr:CBS domain-containing protein [Azospirillum fermentarium]MCW2246282.1 CBS domain-containing protein [Azospirillum fermentarium]